MMFWFVVLSLLAVVEQLLYRFPTEKRNLISASKMAIIYAGLLWFDIVRQAFSGVRIEWWISIVCALSSLILGESFSLLLRPFKIEAKKTSQNLPSYFSFVAFFIVLQAFGADRDASWMTRHQLILIAAVSSVPIEWGVRAVSGRLVLGRQSPQLTGLPILLLAVGFVLLGFYGFHEIVVRPLH